MNILLVFDNLAEITIKFNNKKTHVHSTKKHVSSGVKTIEEDWKKNNG